jgi:hypothetical protein
LNSISLISFSLDMISSLGGSLTNKNAKPAKNKKNKQMYLRDMGKRSAIFSPNGLLLGSAELV